MHIRELLTAILFCIAVSLMSCRSDGKGTWNPENSTVYQSEWVLQWSDEFNSSELDATSWVRIGRLGRGNWNLYTSADCDSLVTIKNGNLILRGIRNDGLMPGDTATYLTGGVWSKNIRSFTGGRLEIRAKLQGAQGAWPALWMKNVDEEKTDNTKRVEIDIMERYNYDNIIYASAYNYYIQKLGIRDPYNRGTGYIDTDGYNIFWLEIYEDELVFGVNDSTVLNYPRVYTAELDEQFPYYQPLFLIMDMQLGGDWTSPDLHIEDDDLPVEMKIDYVRYYQLQYTPVQ